MPRPKKRRLVSAMPEVTVFKPAGVPRLDLEEIVLTIEELEAIRLKDVEGLDQAECAARMSISRPTFQRVLGSARTKVATMLTRGLALRVEGGSFHVGGRRWCGRCEQEVKSDTATVGEASVCPRCGSELGPDSATDSGDSACHGPGRGRGRRWRQRLQQTSQSSDDRPE